MQQPTQLKTLHDLLAQAAHYAEFCMRNKGTMPPTLFLVGAEGPMMILPGNITDGKSKDDLATTARLICIAHAATACVLAMEVWAKFAVPGEKLDETEPPSEAFDRREFVTLMGEDRVRPKQKFLPIIRSGNGKFFGFGDSDVPTLEKMEGRFAQILPPKVADDQMRLLAKTMLKIKGINISQSGAPSRLRRFRS
jgi:hypothetical protein